MLSTSAVPANNSRVIIVNVLTVVLLWIDHQIMAGKGNRSKSNT